MKTHDLISRLARDLEPVDRSTVGRRLSLALIAGLAGGTIVLVTVFGIHSEMPEQMLTIAFWTRAAFPLAVIAAALQLVERLGRPGVALRSAWGMTLLPIITVMLGAVGFVVATPPQFRLSLVSGSTEWTASVAHVVLLSLPSLAATIHAMRRSAPARLVLAGAGAGLMAGAQGVLIYALYCPEMPVPYWGILHVLAIGITTAIGAALGPHCLRW